MAEPIRRMEQPDEETRLWAVNNACVGKVRSARVIEVIEVTSITGLGVEGSVLREVTHYSLPDGTFLAEEDPCR